MDKSQQAAEAVEKFKNSEIYKKIKSYDKRILDFNNDFTPAVNSTGTARNPKEEGLYITIRCGFAGIYQCLNRWKDGKWQNQVLDGSTTIAFSKQLVDLGI